MQNHKQHPTQQKIYKIWDETKRMFFQHHINRADGLAIFKSQFEADEHLKKLYNLVMDSPVVPNIHDMRDRKLSEFFIFEYTLDENSAILTETFKIHNGEIPPTPYHKW